MALRGIECHHEKVIHIGLTQTHGNQCLTIPYPPLQRIASVAVLHSLSAGKTRSIAQEHAKKEQHTTQQDHHSGSRIAQHDVMQRIVQENGLTSWLSTFSQPHLASASPSSRRCCMRPERMTGSYAK